MSNEHWSTGKGLDVAENGTVSITLATDPSEAYGFGTFMRFTDTDEEGPYMYDGEVVAFGPGFITILTQHGGEMTFESDAEKWKKIKKPAGWNQTRKTAPPVVKKAKKARTVEDIDPDSKLGQAVFIYRQFMEANEGEHPPRKTVVKAFAEVLGMSRAGASTYQNKVKKLLTQ